MLKDSIQAVETLLVKTVAERNSLAVTFSDEHQDVVKLNNYISELVTVLQRTNLYFYEHIHNEANLQNRDEVESVFKLDIEGIKADLQQHGEVCMELEDYFSEKLQIARCYKNFLSESSRTIKTKSNILNTICEKYDFGYGYGEDTPYCPILPDVDQLNFHNWEDGCIVVFDENNKNLPISMLNPSDYLVILSPKPKTFMSLKNAENNSNIDWSRFNFTPSFVKGKKPSFFSEEEIQTSVFDKEMQTDYLDEQQK